LGLLVEHVQRLVEAGLEHQDPEHRVEVEKKK
jgi:hypothetical protein